MVAIPILPPSLRQVILACNHDAPTAGHQGFEHTLSRIKQSHTLNRKPTGSVWPRMSNATVECTKSQQSKVTPQRAPLKYIPIGHPWEMIAVNILEEQMISPSGTGLLYKWAEAISMPDQTARQIKELMHTSFQPTVHGRNFEGTILAQTLEAFGVTKSRITAYHPQGDGMVERFNRSLLQLLRSYVNSQSDWEYYLPLVFYAYHTATHTST